MRGVSKGKPFMMAIMIVIAVSGITSPGEVVHAEESGTFEGTLTASGNRQELDYVEGRSVFTFALSGHVNLAKALGGTGDFWSEWIGLWDTQTGGTVRCVWDDLKGQKIYVVLTGTQLEKGATVTGAFVGGTGAFQGIQGDIIFTWTSVSFDTGDKVIAGYAKDIRGAYRIP